MSKETPSRLVKFRYFVTFMMLFTFLGFVYKSLRVLLAEEVTILPFPCLYLKSNQNQVGTILNWEDLQYFDYPTIMICGRYKNASIGNFSFIKSGHQEFKLPNGTNLKLSLKDVDQA